MNSEALRRLEHPIDPTIDNCLDKLLRVDSQPRSSSQAGALGSSEVDHVMTDSQATQPATSTNPFAALEADNPEAEDAMEMKEGWTFQGRKKHTPKIASLRQVLFQSTTLTSNHDITPGGRRKRTHSDVHSPYFTSLGISSPPGQEHARARIWPVLSREKNAQKEILIYARNNTLPSLPLSIRITGLPEEEWTHATALADITQSIESELEDKILKYSLNLKDCLSLEWSW
ncbi:unnamed protein product [Sphagnum tenellum]